MSDSENDNLALDSVFTEPPRPPSPEPTTAIYSRSQENARSADWSSIEIRLVGSHPLWGHHLWNASRAFATYLDLHPELYADRSVLELGAGGGLPGIVAALNGAASVLLTDYPDASLLDNLQHNVDRNIPENKRSRVKVEGYTWGHSVESLRQLNRRTNGSQDRFHLIIMSDLVFNHSQHDALLKTAEESIVPISDSPTVPPCVLVFYTHHRPHLAHRDMVFFQKARERGWNCEEILTERFPPMFPEDSGDEEVRSTVHGWKLTR
ncbi:nicotinamide N-methyltransferase [Panus rudis PR-1116 ss-1]|nr:nicotinamide N-methyltransferase [Panus rudis PR-1116 ss-1]